MNIERYPSKKIPTNEDIYRFLAKYGLIVAISIVIIFTVFCFICSSITKIVQCGDVEWSIDESKENTVIYKSDIYKIIDINSYDLIGKLNIELEKID